LNIGRGKRACLPLNHKKEENRGIAVGNSTLLIPFEGSGLNLCERDGGKREGARTEGVILFEKGLSFGGVGRDVGKKEFPFCFLAKGT